MERTTEELFHAEMHRIYERARDEADYRATRFLQLISERGGLAAAKQLLTGPPSDGLTTLLLKGRPDLAVEALVQQTEFRSLFTQEELRVAVERVGDMADSQT